MEKIYSNKSAVLLDAEKSAIAKIRDYFWRGNDKAISEIINKYQRIAEVVANNGCDDRTFKGALTIIEKGQEAIEALGA